MEECTEKVFSGILISFLFQRYLLYFQFPGHGNCLKRPGRGKGGGISIDIPWADGQGYFVDPHNINY